MWKGFHMVTMLNLRLCTIIVKFYLEGGFGKKISLVSKDLVPPPH